MSPAQIVKIAKALADPTRHRILEQVRAKGSLTCSDVCGLCDQAQPTISHHVKTLAEAGLLTVKREGQYHVLSLNADVLSAFATAVAGPVSPPEERKGRAKIPAKRPVRASAR